ncbi:MAG: hypothetical protein RMM17_00215 [Acidobacteriota bacterium]|nr:hypothetical protein [Blastocatellia bacterium]MDW8411089.1 hypothetical protein [Acidobacteriota bacterium]
MLLVALLLCSLQLVEDDAKGQERNVLVTAKLGSGNEKKLKEFFASDFVVKEQGIVQKILSVSEGKDVPVVLGLFIQDDLVSQVNVELKGLKSFVLGLPKGSKVMVAYITSGALGIQTKFTEDLQAAADSIRILRGAPTGTPFNPYVPFLEGLRLFQEHSRERKIAILISDGIDLARGIDQAAPGLSLDLDRAIKEAQRREVVVYTLYAPSGTGARLSNRAFSFGQGCLVKIAEETGGESFFSGLGFMTFAPHLSTIKGLLDRQWLITYRSDTPSGGFCRLDVDSETGLKIYKPAGYPKP